MPNSSNYTQWIRLLDWNGLSGLWSGIRAGRTPGWEPGKAFEYLILRAFELDGAEVRWPYEVPLDGEVVEQIDGAVYAAELACLVEAKDTDKAVDFEAIAKLKQQLNRRPPGVMGLLFTRSRFTPPATKLAQILAPQNILLWTGDDVSVVLRRREIVWALEAKYRYCVEFARRPRNQSHVVP